MLCLYGVVEATHPLPDGKGVADADLRLIVQDDLAVVSSELPDGAQLDPSDAYAFLDVLLALLDDGVVLPLAFGTVAETDETVAQDFLEPQAPQLRSEIERLRDLVEVHVDVDDDEAAVIAEISASADIKVPLGADFSERVQVGERVAALLVEHRRALAAELVDALGRHAVDASPRSEISGPEDPVLRWAFLVRRDSLPEFNEAQTDLQQEHPELAVRSVGPLPPARFLALSAADPPADSTSGGGWGW